MSFCFSISPKGKVQVNLEVSQLIYMVDTYLKQNCQSTAIIEDNLSYAREILYVKQPRDLQFSFNMLWFVCLFFILQGGGFVAILKIRTFRSSFQLSPQMRLSLSPWSNLSVYLSVSGLPGCPPQTPSHPESGLFLNWRAVMQWGAFWSVIYSRILYCKTQS